MFSDVLILPLQQVPLQHPSHQAVIIEAGPILQHGYQLPAKNKTKTKKNIAKMSKNALSLPVVNAIMQGPYLSYLVRVAKR